MLVVECLDLKLDFIDDRFGKLEDDKEETLETLLREYRSDVGVVLPLEMLSMSVCWFCIFLEFLHTPDERAIITGASRLEVSLAPLR